MSRRKASLRLDAGCRCPDWLIAAWYELVHHSAVRAESIAELMGVHVSTLYNFATRPDNPSGHHRCASSAYLIPATKAAGNPVLIQALARQAGLETPRPSTPIDETAQLILRRALVEIGKNIQQVAGAMPDSPLDSVEEQRIAYSLSRLRDVADSFVVKHEADATNVTPFPRRKRA